LTSSGKQPGLELRSGALHGQSPRRSLSLLIPTLERVAELVGDLPRLQRQRERHARFAQTWSVLQTADAWKRQLETITDYAEQDYDRLHELLRWLEANPSSNLYIRQLPIPGIDTKWIDSRRRTLITDLLQRIRGGGRGADFHAERGLRQPPHRIRMRVLCPTLQQQLGGLEDIEAPLHQVSALSLRPTRVLIVENLETGLALPELAGTVAFMKLGLGVGVLAQLRWLQDARAVRYWGDLDTHGFACLDRARTALPSAQSILMDEATLLAHRPLWVREAEPYRGPELLQLTAAEKLIYECVITPGAKRCAWSRSASAGRAPCTRWWKRSELVLGLDGARA